MWTAPREAAGTAVAQPPQAEKADADTCHTVYTDLFKLCPLTAAHRAQLVGFTDAQVSRYGSLPPQGSAGQRHVLDALIETYGWPTLAMVPGFALGENKERSSGAAA